MSQTLGSYIAFDVTEAMKISTGSGYGRDTYLVIFKTILCYLIFLVTIIYKAFESNTSSSLNELTIQSKLQNIDDTH